MASGRLRPGCFGFASRLRDRIEADERRKQHRRRRQERPRRERCPAASATRGPRAPATPRQNRAWSKAEARRRSPRRRARTSGTSAARPAARRTQCRAGWRPRPSTARRARSPAAPDRSRAWPPTPCHRGHRDVAQERHQHVRDHADRHAQRRTTARTRRRSRGRDQPAAGIHVAAAGARHGRGQDRVGQARQHGRQRRKQ